MDPMELTDEGTCASCDAGVEVGGQHSSHRIKSMSWHDFVRREGAVLEELRQLPLPHVSFGFL